MTILYVLIALFAGAGYVERVLSGGTHYLVFSVIQAVTFAAGVFIILSGVRLVLAEIVPAFKGISDKLVPDLSRHWIVRSFFRTRQTPY